MCTVKCYKAKECKHEWLVIKTSCGWGKGFKTCLIFNNGRYKASATLTPCWTSKTKCPWHGLKGNYDFNQIRMIEKVRPALPRSGATGAPVMICCCVQ